MSFAHEISSLTPILCPRCMLPMKSYVDHPKRKITTTCPRCEEKEKTPYHKLLELEKKPSKKEKKMYVKAYQKEWD